MPSATVRSRPVLVTVAVLVLACSTAAPAGAGSKAAAPYDVAVRVEFAGRVGSASVREWAAQEIVRELDQAGCFTSVRIFRPDGGAAADLLLRLVVRDFEEKTEHETTLARRNDPNAPPTERLRLIASLEVWGDMELWTLPDRFSVRARDIHVERGYRPSRERTRATKCAGCSSRRWPRMSAAGPARGRASGSRRKSSGPERRVAPRVDRPSAAC